MYVAQYCSVLRLARIFSTKLDSSFSSHFHNLQPTILQKHLFKWRFSKLVNFFQSQRLRSPTTSYFSGHSFSYFVQQSVPPTAVPGQRTTTTGRHYVLLQQRGIEHKNERKSDEVHKLLFVFRIQDKQHLE